MHYKNVIRDAERSNKFCIYDMQNSFYNFKMFPNRLEQIRRKKDTEKDYFSIQKICAVRFTEFGKLSYKTRFQETAPKETASHKYDFAENTTSLFVKERAQSMVSMNDINCNRIECFYMISEWCVAFNI